VYKILQQFIKDAFLVFVLISDCKMSDQFTHMKPLTKGMIECLMDCHEREMLNMPPHRGTIKFAGGLLKRKLLTSRIYRHSNGKNYISLYTTQLGRDYLDSIK